MFKKKQKSYSLELSHLIYSSSILEYKQSEITEGAKLGTGGFGKVVEGLYKTLKFAIKKIKQYDSKAIYRELFIMKKFSHPYIPQLYGIIKKPMKRNTTISMGSDKVHEKILGYEKNDFTRKQTEVCKEDNENLERLNKVNLDFIIELVEGESLEKMLANKNGLTNLERIIVLLNLATVLEYLHGFKLIHRDLKPDNIMIDKKFEFKLLDFGISKVGSQSNSTRTVSIGTMMYMAPENFNLGEDDECEGAGAGGVGDNTGSQSFKELKEINEKVDVWAFGCIVQQVMVGVKPWMNKVKTNNKILSLLYKKIPFEISSLVKDEKTRNLIQKCTEINPEKRISMKDAKILMLEILVNEFKIQANNHNLNEDTLEKGLISIYKMFESISNKEKFHLIRKVQFYIFEYFRYLNNKNHEFIMHNKSLLIKEKEINKQILQSKFLHDYENIEHVKERKLKGIDKFLKDLKHIEKKKISKIFNLDSIIMKVSRRLSDADESKLKSILKTDPNREKKRNLKVQFKISFDNNSTYHSLPRSPRQPINHLEKISKKINKIEKVEEFQLVPYSHQSDSKSNEKEEKIVVEKKQNNISNNNSSENKVEKVTKKIERSFTFVNKLKKSIKDKDKDKNPSQINTIEANPQIEDIKKPEEKTIENKFDQEDKLTLNNNKVVSEISDKITQIIENKTEEDVSIKSNAEPTIDQNNKSKFLKVTDDVSTETASPIPHGNMNKSSKDTQEISAINDLKIPDSSRPEVKKKRFIFESLNLAVKVNNDKKLLIPKMERKFSIDKLKVDLTTNVEIYNQEKNSKLNTLLISKSTEINFISIPSLKTKILEVTNEVNFEITNLSMYGFKSDPDRKKTFPIKLSRIPSRTMRAKLGRSEHSSLDIDLTSNHSLIKTTAADLSKLTRPHYKNIILEKLAKKYPKKLKIPSDSHDYISISKVIFSPNDVTYK